MTHHLIGVDIADNLGQVIDIEEEYDTQFEQEDDSTIKQFHLNVTCGAEKDNKLECQSLIVGFGQAASLFLDNFIGLSKSEVAGEITSTVGEDGSSDKVCDIHRQGDHLVLSLPNPLSVLAADCHRFTAALTSCVTAQRLVILCSAPQSSYLQRKEYEDEVDILRQLSTASGRKSSNNTASSKVRHLEQPNIVEGLPAALFTHCQVSGTEAWVYVSYQESYVVDVFAIKSFEPVLREPCVDGLTLNASKQDVAAFVRGFEGSFNQNLYV